MYSAWHCPFAQRTWIAFLEKGVSFEIIETNPYDKPPDLLAVNPRGLVPAIVHKHKCIYESTVCLEYIEEVFLGGSPLLPDDPYERAYVRMWGDFIGKKIVPTMYRLLKLSDQTLEIESELLNNFAELSAAMSDEGLYFMGKHFGYADIMLVPFTLRLYILKHFRGFEIPDTEEYAKLKKWMDVCHSHKSVVPTLVDSDKLLTFHGMFVERNTSEADVARKINQL